MIEAKDFGLCGGPVGGPDAWPSLVVTGVTVAGIGTAAGTGLVGDVDWAWKGLGWLPDGTAAGEG